LHDFELSSITDISLAVFIGCVTAMPSTSINTLYYLFIYLFTYLSSAITYYLQDALCKFDYNEHLTTNKTGAFRPKLVK